MCFVEVMKGYDYKNLNSLVVNDQMEVGKTKKRKCAKDSSKSDLMKKSTKSMEGPVKGNNVKVEVTHLDEPEVVDKGLEENKVVEGDAESLEKKMRGKKAEKEREMELA